MTRATRCLTLWQPFAWSVSDGGKDIENRPLPPPVALLGQPIAIAAAARIAPRYEADAASHILVRTGVTVPRDLPRSAILAVATLDRVVDARADTRLALRMNDGYPWWLGPVGIFLRDVVRIEPLDISGDKSFHRGYWRMNDDLQDEVERRVAAARENGHG